MARVEISPGEALGESPPPLVEDILCVQTWKPRPAGGGVPGLLGVGVGWKTVKRPFESGGAFKGSLFVY